MVGSFHFLAVLEFWGNLHGCVCKSVLHQILLVERFTHYFIGNVPLALDLLVTDFWFIMRNNCIKYSTKGIQSFHPGVHPVSRLNCKSLIEGTWYFL